MEKVRRELDSMDEEMDFDDEDDDTLEGRFLIFALAERHYGIEIKNITEIVGLQTITEIPDMPIYVKGVVNLRGKVILLMDIRLRFGMESISYGDKTCVIILNLGGIHIGLIVDTVKEVIRINSNDIEEAPRLGDGDGSRFVQGIAKVNSEVKVLLSLERIIKEEDGAAVEAALAANE